MRHTSKVFKNASIISVAIFVSRILGFLRDVLIATFLGTGELAQAFFVAFRIPNLFRDIIAEGAANSSIIPVLTECKLNCGDREYRKLISSLQFIMITVLLSLIIFGEVAAKYIVFLIAPGFKVDPSLFNMTVRLMRLLFPFILFIGLFGLNMSILHTEERFLSTSIGQPMFNLAMILSILFLSSKFGSPIYALVVGVWAGGFALVIAQILDLNLLGYKVVNWKPSFHPAVKKIFSLLGPRLIGTIIYHINILADTILASLSFIVGRGGIAAIYYASRLMQFPLALFSISVAQAILPRLSHLNCENPNSIKETFRNGLELVMFLVIPSSAFLMRENKLIVEVLFKRGAFNLYSVEITSAVLFYYAIGLSFFAGIKMLVSAFYSLQDTKTPVKTAGLSLIVNIVLSVIFMFPMKVAGLAFASAIAGAVNFSLLFFLMDKRIHFVTKEFLLEMGKILLGGAVVYFILGYVKLNASLFSMLIRVFFVAVGAYMMVCGMVRIRVWRNFVNFLVRRLSRGK